MPEHLDKSVLTQVQARLNGKFPSLPDEVVEAAVRVAAAGQLDADRGQGVRRVELAAGERLSALLPD